MRQSVLRILRSIGPAIIVASVVLGPGSILTASRVGASHGYARVWVLIAARLSLPALAAGMIPSLPEQNVSTASILGLFATTFSVAGAFYQAYLVREKGWKIEDAPRGLIDTLLGVGVLAGLTLMVMATSAAVLHGRVDASALESAADVARRLEPMFGSWAVVLAIGTAVEIARRF